jgi:hypothetical protein
MAAQTGAPLAWNIQVTDSRGYPTPEFQRRWEDLRNINGSIPQLSTPAQVSALLDIIGSTRGSVLERSAAGWVVLPPGTSGYVLTSNGAGADPAYAAIPNQNIQTLLDSIGNTRGSILYRGASGWALLTPSTAGYVLTTHGAGADPTWAAGGGGGAGGGLYNQVMSATPTSAGIGFTTWVNQGSSTIVDGATGVCMTVPLAGTDSNTLRTFAAPATPYTITALLASTRSSSAFNGVALGWYDGTNKIHSIALTTDSGGGNYIEVNKWATPTSFSGHDYTSAANAYSQPIWFQIKDDGTNVFFRYGQDGANFFQAFTVAKSSGFLGASGYSNLAFGVNPVNSQAIATILSWTKS